MSLIHKNLIESITLFNVVTWHNYLNLRQKNKINGKNKICSRIVDENSSSISQLYNILLKRKAKQFKYDKKHPLHNMIERMPSGRRYRTPLAKKLCIKSHLYHQQCHLLTACNEIFLDNQYNLYRCKMYFVTCKT